MKEKFITAYTWAFGCTRADAAKAWRRADAERKNLIIASFEENAKRSFNDD